MNLDLAASFNGELFSLAKRRGEVFQSVLTQFGVERFLCLLSLTPPREALFEGRPTIQPLVRVSPARSGWA